MTPTPPAPVLELAKTLHHTSTRFLVANGYTYTGLIAWHNLPDIARRQLLALAEAAIHHVAPFPAVAIDVPVPLPTPPRRRRTLLARLLRRG